MDQVLSIECLLVPLLQLTGPLQDKLPHLFILAAKRGGKLLLARGEVLFLGFQCGLVLDPSGFDFVGQVLHRLLGLMNVGQLHGEVHVALGQLALCGLQLLVSLAEPVLHLGDALLEVRLRFLHHRRPGPDFV